MKYYSNFLYRITLVVLIISFVFSCQITPTPVLPDSENTFKTQSWPTEDTGTPRTFSGSMNYQGTEHKEGGTTFSLSTENDEPIPRYSLVLTDYKLKDGKQIATKAQLGISAYNYKPNDRGYIHFFAELESTNGVFFNVVSGEGAVRYNYQKPDPAYHGNMGYNCNFIEEGIFNLDNMSGNMTLHSHNQSFSATLSVASHPGTVQHGLSPWQCAYRCEGTSDDNDVYNEVCYENASVSGSLTFSGDIFYMEPYPLHLGASHEVISPANQDGLFDDTWVYDQNSKLNQIYRFTLPSYNNEPMIKELRTPSVQWSGKKNDHTFYNDGKYSIEVLTDQEQKKNHVIEVDNTPPVAHEPRLVKRAGHKAIEVIVEDPIVNGASAGLHSMLVNASINSYRPGSWNVSKVRLNKNQVLLSAVLTPSFEESSDGIYDESISVWGVDQVYNTLDEKEFSFDFNQDPEEEEPLTPEEESCENAPLLLPEAVLPFVEGTENVEPVNIQEFNQFRKQAQQLQNTVDRLAAEGIEVSGPEPIAQPHSLGSFLTQSLAKGDFYIASAEPSYDSSGDPSNYPENPSIKVQRLLDKYGQQKYSYQEQRDRMLSELRTLDANLQQLLLNSTAVLDAEYEPETTDSPQSFEGFKSDINALQENFVLQVQGNNTYYLLEAVQTYANLSLLYNHLLRAQLEGKLPVGNAPTNTEDTRYLSQRLETLTEPWQLVNFTANRLKAFKTQLRNKHNAISSEMHTVLSEAEETAYALESLEKDVALIAQQARNLGAEFELEGETPQGDFSTQAIFAAPVLAPVAAQVGRMVAGRLVGALGKQALRAGGWVLTNPVKATALVANTGRIIAGLSQQQRIPKQQVRRLERQLTGDNLTPERRLEINTEKAEHEALIREIDGVMAMAKERKEEAKAEEKSSKQAKKKSKRKCAAPCLPDDETSDLITDPKSIWDKTKEQIRDLFERNGYKVSLRKGNRSSSDTPPDIIEISSETPHSSITQIKIHPGGGKHGGSYYEVSCSGNPSLLSKYGINKPGGYKVVDRNTYNPLNQTNRTIFYIN